MYHQCRYQLVVRDKLSFGGENYLYKLVHELCAEKYGRR